MIARDIVSAPPDPAAEWRYRRALCHETGTRRYADGYHDGYEQAVRDLERAWQEIARPIKRHAAGPTHAELEARRWGPGGRDHAGDPRPGDFPGRFPGLHAVEATPAGAA